MQTWVVAYRIDTGACRWVPTRDFALAQRIARTDTAGENQEGRKPALVHFEVERADVRIDPGVLTLGAGGGAARTPRGAGPCPPPAARCRRRLAGCS